jgi:hypothetical protein
MPPSYGKWNVPRKAVREGAVVFFPRITTNKAYSILSFERKRGMRIRVVQSVYQDCPGAMVWRVD